MQGISLNQRDQSPEANTSTLHTLMKPAYASEKVEALTSFLIIDHLEKEGISSPLRRRLTKEVRLYPYSFSLTFYIYSLKKRDSSKLFPILRDRSFKALIRTLSHSYQALSN